MRRYVSFCFSSSLSSWIQKRRIGCFRGLLLISSDLLTNNVMFGKCESHNFTSCALHKTVPKNRSNCPIKITISLDRVFAINICIALGYTKNRTLCSYRVTNNTVAVQNASYDEVLLKISSFHIGTAAADLWEGSEP